MYKTLHSTFAGIYFHFFNDEKAKVYFHALLHILVVRPDVRLSSRTLHISILNSLLFFEQVFLSSNFKKSYFPCVSRTSYRIDS